MDKGKHIESEYEDKMCSLGGSSDPIDLDLLKRLVRESRYVCSTCGRTAVNSENLCMPEQL
jgi:hypothetical protein